MILDILQIGAHTGISQNNKNVLDLLNESTKAIFVEPIESLYNELVKNFNQTYPNNTFIYLNKACSNYIGKIKLYVPDVPVYNRQNKSEYVNKKLVYWSDQLSSILPNHVKKHNLDIKVNEIEVDCITLDYIINQYNISEIKYLHIDTEGHDFEILEGLNLNNIKPLKIKFEHKHMEGSFAPTGVKYDSLMSKLYSYHYIVEHKNTEDTLVALQI